MEIKLPERKPLDFILKNIPSLFQDKEVRIKDFNVRMSQPIRLSLTKQDSYQLIKAMEKNGYAEYKRGTGRLLFRRPDGGI
jgi:hypothetical protein